MIIKDFNSDVFIDTDTLKYHEFAQLGTVNNRVLRCKCTLPIEYVDNKAHIVNITTNQVAGKTLAQL